MSGLFEMYCIALLLSWLADVCYQSREMLPSLG